jgi:SH3-like domain-containing protein
MSMMRIASALAILAIHTAYAAPAASSQAASKASTAKPAPATPQPATPQPAAPQPADPKPQDAKQDEAKPAAHFASLRAEKVYLRTGPSTDFPIQWVFVRRGLPVEILAAFDIWRKIRDSTGTEGWVHQGMLTGRRNVLIAGAIRDLRHDPDPAAPVVAQLEPGVLAAVSKCTVLWCEVRTGGYRGWVRHDEIWGLEPNEVIQ